MKIFSTLILSLIFVFAAFAQDETSAVYQIKNVYQNADLNEKAIERFKNNIDLRSETDEIVKLFKPIKGKYKVIVFISSDYGIGANDKKDIFHNILILKVDKTTKYLTD